MAVNDEEISVTTRIMVVLERPADWPDDRMWTDLDASLTARVGSAIAPTMRVGEEQVPLGGEYVVAEVRIVEDGRRLMVVGERRAASKPGDAPALGWTDWYRRGLDGRIGEKLLPGELVEPPEHRVARERADDEQERIAARYATGGVIEGPRDPKDDRIPIVLTGCLDGQHPGGFVEPPESGVDMRYAAGEVVLTHEDVIAHLREQTLARKARAHGGQGELVDEVRGQWATPS